MGQVPSYPALVTLVPGDLTYIARPSEGTTGSHSFDLGTELLQVATNTTDIAAETARAEAAESVLSAQITAFNIGLFNQASSHNIPTGTDRVETTGYTVLGKGAAHYILDPDQAAYSAKGTAYVLAAIALGVVSATAYAALATLEAHWRFKSSNNRWFTLNEVVPTSDMFGTLGDAVQTSGNVITGTVVTAACQAFIDYCVYFKLCEGRWGYGGHRLDDTLHHGYGQAFVGSTFNGGGPAYAGSASFAGAFFISSKTDRPMLNIAGGREVFWENVTWRGQYAKHINDNLLGYQGSPMGALDDLLEASWIMPSISTTQDNRYAPYALVTTDAYAGVRPVAAAYAGTTAYAARDIVFTGGNVYITTTAGTSGGSSAPTGTGAAIADGTVVWRYLGAYDAGNPSNFVSYPDYAYPAWLMTNAQYNKNSYTSMSGLRNCHLEGANTLTCSHPCNNSLQGDFLWFDRCELVFSKFAVSVGNDQSRNVDLSNCQFAFYYDMLTNRTHGTQRGKYGGTVRNCSFGAGIYALNITQAYAPAITFQNCYCEGQRALGKLVPSGVGDFGVVFDHCDFNFAFTNDTRGRVAKHLFNPNAATVAASAISSGVMFRSGRINFDSVIAMFLDGVRFDGTLLYAYEHTTNGTVRRAGVHNATSGGLILNGLEYRRTNQNITFPQMNLDTGAAAFQQVATDRGYTLGSRAFGLPLVVKTARATSDPEYEEIPVPNSGPLVLSKASVTVTYSATEMTVVFTGSNQATSADLQGFGPGSIVLDIETGTAWEARSYVDATDTLIANALTNWRDPGSGKVFINAPTTNTGSLYFAHGRNYLPSHPVFADFTATSTAVANVGMSNGVGTSLTADMANGDYLVSPQSTDAMAPATAKISGLTNGSPGSFTLDQAANKTLVGKRFFVRKPCCANA